MHLIRRTVARKPGRLITGTAGYPSGSAAINCVICFRGRSTGRSAGLRRSYAPRPGLYVLSSMNCRISCLRPSLSKLFAESSNPMLDRVMTRLRFESDPAQLGENVDAGTITDPQAHRIQDQFPSTRAPLIRITSAAGSQASRDVNRLTPAKIFSSSAVPTSCSI